MAIGLTCHFIDDWTPYHLDFGEVHCGTNTLRRPADRNAWAATAAARSLAALLAGWGENGDAVYLRALAYLDAAEERYRHTPLGAPRQDICAADLTAYFGDRLALFLAVRLLKQPAWPAWKVMTALTYLYDQRTPESLPPPPHSQFLLKLSS